MDAVKLLGALLGNNATGGNLLGSILGGGGRQSAPQQQSAGAGELLKAILGGGGAPQQQAPSGGGLGGLGGLLGGVLGGGGGAPAGGSATNNILGGLLKGAIAKQMGLGSGGGGGSSPMDLLGGLLGGGKEEPEPVVEAPQRQAADDQATILIRAMCNAAKADGSVDQAEQQAIIGRLGELDQQEIDFLQKELSSPLDAAGFARSVPQELGPQVYALSVMTVKVDTREEVQYLTQLAQGLGLNQQTLDAIHQQAGLS